MRTHIVPGVLLVLTLLTPTAVSAHAALDIATPPDGATVEGSPPEVAGTYTQDLVADGSSLQLRDATGAVIATGGVDPADVRRLVIADLPALAPGGYEVRSTTLSAEDGEVDRATWTFTVVAAPTPVPTSTPAPTVEPSTASSVEPTAAPSATAAPMPTGSDSDVVVPIIAGLALVLIAAVVLLNRRGRSGRVG